MSIIPTINIPEQSELFMHYGYKQAEFPSDFPWYWETKNRLERQERMQKEKKSKKKKKAKKKKQTCPIM